MEYPLVHGGTSVSKSQSSNFIYYFWWIESSIISNLFNYLFIRLFTRLSAALPPPPPPPCDVKSIRRCLSWPPDNNAHLVKKHWRCFYVMNIYISYLPMIVLLWLLLLLVVISLYTSFLVLFFKFSFSTCCCFSFIVVVLFDVVVLAYWFCFYFKTCISRYIIYLRCYWVSIFTHHWCIGAQVILK